MKFEILYFQFIFQQKYSRYYIGQDVLLLLVSPNCQMMSRRKKYYFSKKFIQKMQNKTPIQPSFIDYLFAELKFKGENSIIITKGIFEKDKNNILCLLQLMNRDELLKFLVLQISSSLKEILLILYVKNGKRSFQLLELPREDDKKINDLLPKTFIEQNEAQFNQTNFKGNIFIQIFGNQTSKPPDINYLKFLEEVMQKNIQEEDEEITSEELQIYAKINSYQVKMFSPKSRKEETQDQELGNSIKAHYFLKMYRETLNQLKSLFQKPNPVPKTMKIQFNVEENYPSLCLSGLEDLNEFVKLYPLSQIIDEMRNNYQYYLNQIILSGDINYILQLLFQLKTIASELLQKQNLEITIFTKLNNFCFYTESQPIFISSKHLRMFVKNQTEYFSSQSYYFLQNMLDECEVRIPLVSQYRMKGMGDYKWKTYNKKKDETNINLVDNKLKLKPMFLKSPILSLSCQHYSEAKILNQNNLVCMICSQKVDVLQLVIDEKFERTTNYIQNSFLEEFKFNVHPKDIQAARVFLVKGLPHFEIYQINRPLPTLWTNLNNCINVIQDQLEDSDDRICKFLQENVVSDEKEVEMAKLGDEDNQARAESK